jgi:hypothetical protein
MSILFIDLQFNTMFLIFPKKQCSILHNPSLSIKITANFVMVKITTDFEGYSVLLSAFLTELLVHPHVLLTYIKYMVFGPMCT